MNKFFEKIPMWLASPVSLYIFLFLFFYLVIFPLIGWFVPAVNKFLPSSDVQLVFGNYTNVLSALGASIAAGSSYQAHQKIKDYQSKHETMSKKIDSLHNKVDKLNKKK